MSSRSSTHRCCRLRPRLLALRSPLTVSQSRAKSVDPARMRAAIAAAIASSPFGLSHGAKPRMSGPPLDHRDPTGIYTPQANAASSLESPSAILIQNRRWTSRALTVGRPGERIGALPARSARCAFRFTISNPSNPRCCYDSLNLCNTPRSVTPSDLPKPAGGPRSGRSATPTSVRVSGAGR
jgi:hypothetical protein